MQEKASAFYYMKKKKRNCNLLISCNYRRDRNVQSRKLLLIILRSYHNLDQAVKLSHANLYVDSYNFQTEESFREILFCSFLKHKPTNEPLSNNYDKKHTICIPFIRFLSD